MSRTATVLKKGSYDTWISLSLGFFFQGLRFLEEPKFFHSNLDKSLNFKSAFHLV